MQNLLASIFTFVRLMMRSGLLGTALLTSSLSAHAQVRTDNAGTAGTLRQWPRFGAWRTALTRSIANNALSCTISTGYYNAAQSVRYASAIRQNTDGVALAVAEANLAEIAEPSITVTIDGLAVGT